MTRTTMFGRTAFLAAALALLLTAASEAKAGCSDPAAPYVDWSNCHKYGASLKRTDLKYASLKGADLSLASLDYADLNNADLSGAKLASAYLEGTDLTNANLTNADLTYAVLYLADLTNATLTNADLTNAKLMDGNGEFGADLSGATWTDGRVCAEGSIGVCN